MRNLEFHVLNIRERDVHVFEELRKCNNMHRYTDSCIFPPNGGAQKSRIDIFCLSKCVNPTGPPPLYVVIPIICMYINVLLNSGIPSKLGFRKVRARERDISVFQELQEINNMLIYVTFRGILLSTGSTRKCEKTHF